MPKTIFTGANLALVEVLKKVRLEANLTQAQVGARMQRSQSFVSLIERSQRRVDVVEFYRLALALGYDPIELFSRVSRVLDQYPA